MVLLPDQVTHTTWFKPKCFGSTLSHHIKDERNEILDDGPREVSIAKRTSHSSSCGHGLKIIQHVFW